MVSHKTIKYSKWKRWLKTKGLEHIRTKGDHEIWNASPKLVRPIIFRSGEKEIPLLHIKTNLDTLEITLEDFLKEIEKL